jgi:hypothetical protein
VRDPAGEKQVHCCGGHVGGILSGYGEKLSRVIKRHHDHDGAANHVNRVDAGAL